MRPLSPSQELVVTEKADEAKALVRLAFDELSRIPGGIWGTHKAIADRAFKLTGPVGRLVRFTHHGISDAVYGSLRAGYHAAGVAASAAVRGAPGRVVSTTPLGGAAIGVIDGLIGDSLERDGSALQEPLCVRVGDKPVPPRREELEAAFPNATRKLVVFVHGLMESEFSWRIGAGRSARAARRRVAHGGRADRAGRPLDGRAGGALGLPPGIRAR